MEFEYFTHKGWQDELMVMNKRSQRLENSVAIQFPEEDDLLNQLIDNIDPLTIAQTQLNILE